MVHIKKNSLKKKKDQAKGISGEEDDSLRISVI